MDGEEEERKNEPIPDFVFLNENLLSRSILLHLFVVVVIVVLSLFPLLLLQPVACTYSLRLVHPSCLGVYHV